MENLRELLTEELKDLYSAEKQLLKALPKMAEGASSRTLQGGFKKHLKQTEGHVKRLEKVCDELDIRPSGKTCKAMEGLIQEGQEILDEDAPPEVKDAALIAAAQRVEHYEIAGYGCVRTYATLLGHKGAARLLEQTLKEEGATDKELTRLARRINVQAESPDGRKKRTGRGKSFTKRLKQAVGLS